MTEHAPLLSLAAVNKSFGAVTVANDLTFSLAKGETMGVIGPNGAGKSSMFNLITGNLRPETGDVTFAGQNVTSKSALARCRLGMGRSFQIPQPFGKMSVYENLLVGAAFGSDLPEAAVRDLCRDILQKTGLLHRANEDAGTLSLLDRKRLELARAMATQPTLLLLDEIAGGLTEGECAALIATIQELNADGVAIIWIEHVVNALVAVVDRLCVLNFGALVADGPAKDVMSSDVVREIYMGSPA